MQTLNFQLAASASPCGKLSQIAASQKVQLAASHPHKLLQNSNLQMAKMLSLHLSYKRAASEHPHQRCDACSSNAKKKKNQNLILPLDPQVFSS
jgi:hypothetical protein